MGVSGETMNMLNRKGHPSQHYNCFYIQCPHFILNAFAIHGRKNNKGGFAMICKIVTDTSGHNDLLYAFVM